MTAPASAFYRCEVRPLSRSAGCHATAAAAYRTANRIEDERVGLTYDYRRRSGVEHTMLITPAQATWITDRQTLWNAAEQAEKRINSRVARDVILSFPHQLDQTERIRCGREMAHWLCQEYGVAVDVGWHRPHGKSDDRNYHAHLLMTTRVVTETGLGAKTRQLDDKATGSQEIEKIRQHWEKTLNRALERQQLDVRVDCRSNKARGIERVPQIKLGRAVIEMERHGIATELGDRFRAIQSANENIADLDRRQRAIAQEIAEVERELAAEREKKIAPEAPQTPLEALWEETWSRMHKEGQTPSSGKIASKETLSTQERQQALHSFREAWAALQPLHDATRTDWHTCRLMAQAGFSVAQIHYALRYGSPGLTSPQRQGKRADRYVDRTVAKVMHLPDVRIARARLCDRDQRPDIERILQAKHIDPERSKPRANGGNRHPSKRQAQGIKASESRGSRKKSLQSTERRRLDSLKSRQASLSSPPSSAMKANNATQEAVRQQLHAMNCSQYEVLIQPPNERKPIAYKWKADEILKPDSIQQLQRHNNENCNIFIRPANNEGLILVKNVRADAITRMEKEGCTPAAVLEARPGRFEAWVSVSRSQLAPEVSAQITRNMARAFNGDLPPTDKPRFGRMAGFVNHHARHLVTPQQCEGRNATIGTLIVSEAERDLAQKRAELSQKTNPRTARETPPPGTAVEQQKERERELKHIFSEAWRRAFEITPVSSGYWFSSQGDEERMMKSDLLACKELARQGWSSDDLKFALQQTALTIENRRHLSADAHAQKVVEQATADSDVKKAREHLAAQERERAFARRENQSNQGIAPKPLTPRQRKEEYLVTTLGTMFPYNPSQAAKSERTFAHKENQHTASQKPVNEQTLTSSMPPHIPDRAEGTTSEKVSPSHQPSKTPAPEQDRGLER